MIIVDCPGCMQGEHSRHVEHWGVRPEGVVDGEFCYCKGDCAERAEMALDSIFQQISTEALSLEARQLLADLASLDLEVRDKAVREINRLMDEDPLPEGGETCEWCGERPVTGYACTADGSGEREVACCAECGAEFGWDYVAGSAGEQ